MTKDLSVHAFEAFLKDLDDQLRAEGLAIPARPIQAIVRVSTRLQISLPIASPKKPQSNEDFSPEAITHRIHAWYKERYGNRLNLDPAPSWFACFLGGDPWRVRIPWLVSGVAIAAIRDPKVRSVDSGIYRSEAQPTLLNAFDLVADLPISVRLGCSKSEQADLQFYFGVAVKLSKSLHRIQRLKMVAPALGDFVGSVDKIFHQPTDLGGSRWASLQFIEKLLKAFIFVCGKQPSRKGHDLAQYAKEAGACGLPQHPQSIYDAVQCDPGVRYGEFPVSLVEAMRAHHEAMRLGVAISQAIEIVSEATGPVSSR